jgi:membrane protein YdbS with pleckstrin-like domain
MGGYMFGDRSGTEPSRARSPLKLRTVLSAVALPLALVGMVYFGYRALTERDDTTVWWAEAVILALVSVIAAIDLVVLRRRRREEAAREHARAERR